MIYGNSTCTKRKIWSMDKNVVEFEMAVMVYRVDRITFR